MWETMEVRFGIASLVTAVAWSVFVSLMVVTMLTQMWRLGMMAMGVCGMAVALTVIRDNCKTRRVMRSLARDMGQDRLRGVP